MSPLPRPQTGCQELGKVGASNLIALIAGLLTLRLEKISWIKKSILAGTLKTWAFVFAFYFGFLFLFFPPLREGRVLSWIGFPLMMSTGLMMSPVFGPIQDYFVRNAQRREREKAHRRVDARASKSLDLQRR